MPATRSVDLLATEVGVLWDRDARGRLRQAHHVVLGVAEDGQLLAVGEDVPDDVADAMADALEAAAERRHRYAEPDRPPEVLAYCRERIVSALGPVLTSGGPSYLVPHEGLPNTDGRTYDAQFAGDEGDNDAASVRIVRSDDEAETRDGLRAANPDTWSGDEWADLIAGRLGPWAIATRASRVLAVAHTPVADARGAEAGVWTHPDARGRGLAATVTAHWARLVRDAGRLPFYSTSSDNLSSQRVASRLALRPIGWLWKLSAPDRLGLHAHRPWLPD
ncbi:GNAT family N-acetyltransferase [Actinopolymorpha singaporensis]